MWKQYKSYENQINHMPNPEFPQVAPPETLRGEAPAQDTTKLSKIVLRNICMSDGGSRPPSPRGPFKTDYLTCDFTWFYIVLCVFYLIFTMVLYYFYLNLYVFTWIYLVFVWFYRILILFYVVFTWFLSDFHMILCDFYSFWFDFHVILYEFL